MYRATLPCERDLRTCLNDQTDRQPCPLFSTDDGNRLIVCGCCTNCRIMCNFDFVDD